MPKLTIAAKRAQRILDGKETLANEERQALIDELVVPKHTVTLDVTPVVVAAAKTSAFFKQGWLAAKAKIHEATK